MKGVILDELESAIVETVSKNNGDFYPADVAVVMAKFGWEYNDVLDIIDVLVDKGVLLSRDGLLYFEFPEDDGAPATIPYLDQIQQVLASTIPSQGHDPVNSPSHYTRGGIEAIDFIEAKGLGFCLGNVVKYVSRAGFKADAKIQDLEKAQWYLTREIARMKKGA